MRQSVACSNEWFSPLAEFSQSVILLIKKSGLQKCGIACLATRALVATDPAFAQKPVVPVSAPASHAEAVPGAHSGEKTLLNDGARADSADSRVAAEAKTSSPGISPTSSIAEAITTTPAAGFFMTTQASAPNAATSASASASQPNEQGRSISASAAAVAYPRAVTIDFAPAVANRVGASPKATHTKAFTVKGELSNLAAEPPQRGVAAPHAGAPVRTAPMTSSPVVGVPRAPISGIRIAPIRPGRGTAFVNRPFWFLNRPVAGTPRVFNPRRRHPPFDGFGFFPGFGFGFPFFGFAADCNPFWAWPWAFGCESLGYWDGYNAGFLTGDNSQLIEPEEPAMESEQQQPETFTYIPPPDESSPEEIEAEKMLVVLYMKDGSVYAVTNYWVQDGKLHYKTSYGGEDTIDMDKIDLQKTVDVNAKRGVQFTLKPTPDQDPPNPQPPQQQQNLPEPQD